jgi:hypothetical protein
MGNIFKSIYPKKTRCADRTNLHICYRCNIHFKPLEEIIIKSSSTVHRYHVECAILVNIWDEKTEQQLLFEKNVLIHDRHRKMITTEEHPRY